MLHVFLPPEPAAAAAVPTESRNVDEVFALRQAYWRNGYRPVPVYTRQKRPRGDNWRADALRDPPLWATRWPEDVALGTGLVTGELIGADVDILIQSIADRVVFDIEQTAGPTPLVRIGRAPKVLLCYRADRAFPKLNTGTFTMPDGTEAHVEILAEGQQFVADGIHPDTGQAYLWPNRSPEYVPLAELPVLTLEQGKGIIDRARQLIIANGGVEKKPPSRQRKSDGGAQATGTDTFFAKVNEAALRNLAAWVKALFPKAVYQPGTGAWRVASKDRGRPDLQEDISLHPDGIQDFGLEQGLTPIDVVIEHGSAGDAVAAAHWLCERLGIDPTALGWHQRANAPDAGASVEQRTEATPSPAAAQQSLVSGADLPDDTTIDVLVEIEALGHVIAMQDLVEIFNRKYAVAQEGGRALVIWAVHDPLLKRDRHERASFGDFVRFYQNHTLSVRVGKKTVARSYGACWLDHPQRRQYLGGVVFDPAGRSPATTLNLWRGWTVTPTPGDWSLMQNHIKTVICGGRNDIYDYLIRWLAHMVQKPHLPAETAVVLRGLKGTGKGILGKWLLRLCGQHGLHVVNATHLTGRFTGHLRDAIFIFADEAFFAGDKQHESVLKGIITEGEILIEAKYRTPVMAPNMLHLLMASNATWVIPASHDERRYLMLDVAPDKKGDLNYFRELDQQMDQGGLAAMLHDLLRMDLGDFHPRAVPATTELTEQKLHSLDTLQRWWLTVLDRGFVWRSRYGHKDFLRWDEFVSTELLNNSYRQWCSDNRVNYPEHREALGSFMEKFYPHRRPRGAHAIYEAESVDREHPEPVVKQDRPYGFLVGDAPTARRAFADKLNLPHEALPWEPDDGDDDAASGP